MLDERGLFADGSVFVEREGRCGTSTILGGEKDAVFLVETDVGGTSIPNWLGIDEGQIIVGIHAPSGNGGLPNFTNGVEAAPI